MPGHADWDPYKTHVQGGLREGNFVNGQFVMICAGPPHLSDIGAGAAVDALNKGTTNVAFPIGLTQNISISQNKAISRIFEIGSDRSYFITGRTVGQLSLSRVVYHGPSLLKCLMAYYGSTADGAGTYNIDELYASGAKNSPLLSPLTDSAKTVKAIDGVQVKGGLHGVHVPPGFDNLYLNLASDLFSQPLGLLLLFKDNAMNDVASVYLEQCYIPTHSIALDSQGLIVQESVGIQYERIVPIKNTAVKLMKGIIADPQGSRSY